MAGIQLSGITDGEQFCFPLFQPALRITGVALGAASILAGMVRVLLVAADFALGKMAPHEFRAAGDDTRQAASLPTSFVSTRSWSFSFS